MKGSARGTFAIQQDVAERESVLVALDDLAGPQKPFNVLAEDSSFEHPASCVDTVLDSILCRWCFDDIGQSRHPGVLARSDET